MITIRDALKSLTPSANWSADDDEIVEWYSPSITQPTKAELDAEVERLQAEFDAQEYARNRQAEYPPLDDLIVALWEGVVEERMASIMELEVQRQAVKEKYPK